MLTLAWSYCMGAAILSSPAVSAGVVYVASTNGIKANDSTYLTTENAIQALTSRRDALVAQMKVVINGGSPAHLGQLIRDGQSLLADAATLAGS